MMFLNVMLAGFVVLGAVPIIIHLLNKRRFRIIEWAAINFLLKTLQKNSRRLQLRDLILLALRTLAVILVALALARPTLAPGHFALFGGAAHINAVVVLDNSRSMGYREGSDTRFAQAKVKAKAVLDQLPKGSSAALVLMSDVGATEMSDVNPELSFVADKIDKAQLTDGGTSITAGLSKAWDILKRSVGAREIYLVTDLQANAWPSGDDGGWKSLCSDLGKREDLRLFLADVGSGEGENVSIDELQPVDPLVTTDSDSAFVATVRNHGRKGADNVEVQLLVDDGHGGDMHPANSVALDHLETSQQVVLQTRFDKGGRHRVEARIGPDHLEADNHRYLAIDVIDRLKVLIVDGSAEGGYTGGANFIRSALAPGATQGDEGAAGSLIDAEVISAAALIDTPLESYQAVILSDVPELTAGEADGLKTFVAGGKALVMFLGANVRPTAYNQLLGARAGLLPAAIGDHPIELASGDKAKGMTLATSGLSHPIVSFFTAKDILPYLTKPLFKQAFALTLPKADEKARGGASIVERFADGSPMLVERPVGAGTVLLFATAADHQWSNFPLTPAFLILVKRTVQHAVLSRRVPATLRVHDNLVAQLTAREAGSHMLVSDPHGGKATITANLATDGRTASVETADTDYAGFWRVGEGAGAKWFAVNGPAEESDLTPTTHDHIAAISSPMQWQWIGNGADVATEISRSRVGHEIWPLLITIGIAFLIVESYLAMAWSPKGNAP